MEMGLDALLYRFRLASGGETRRLTCSADGLSLGGVSLLRKTAEGFYPRASEEVEALILAAYGQIGDRGRLARGLHTTASALNRGDLELAMIAAVHLRLPDLTAEGALQIAAVADFLAKYDPDEPRDWRGRWTTGGESAGGQANPRPSPRPASSVASGWDGISHPTGGVLTLTGGGEDEDYGSNEPRWEMRPESEPPPTLNVPKVQPGWDVDNDGRIDRKPTLRDGRPWPPASVEIVIESLRRDRGAPPPKMWIFVPLDGKGPPLVGSTSRTEFVEPLGYDKVELIGMPQETWRQGARSNHARDSVKAALRYAMSNNYSRIYFNSALSKSTGGEVDAPLRPDMLGVVRPELDLGYRFKPYESYSPGQASEPRETLLQLLHPEMAEPEGRHYKFLVALWTRLLRKIAAAGDSAGVRVDEVLDLFLKERKRLLINPMRAQPHDHGTEP